MSEPHIERSFLAALKILNEANIAVRPDLKGYARQRRQWELAIRRIGPILGYRMTEIDCRQAET